MPSLQRTRYLNLPPYNPYLLARISSGLGEEFQGIDKDWQNYQQSQALLSAIKEYENNKWKVIGQKVGKPAKVWGQIFSSLANSANP